MRYYSFVTIYIGFHHIFLCAKFVSPVIEVWINLSGDIGSLHYDSSNDLAYSDRAMYAGCILLMLSFGTHL